MAIVYFYNGCIYHQFQKGKLNFVLTKFFLINKKKQKKKEIKLTFDDAWD